MGPILIKKALPYRRIEDLSILHIGERRLFLNESGTAIWEQIDGKRSANEIVEKIVQQRQESLKSAKLIAAQINQFLNSLVQLTLIEEQGSTGPRENASAFQSTPTPMPLRDGQDFGAKPAQDVCVTARNRGAWSVKSAAEKDKPPTVEDRLNDLCWEKFYIQKMHLELTYRCNFRCIQCYNTTHAGTDTELKLEEWESVLQQLSEMGCHSVTFTGGEIFVRKDAIEILRTACRNGFSFRINTNGSLIDERMLEKLEPLRAFIQSFDVSFYGATPLVHDTLARRLGGYQATLRAVKLLAGAKMNLLTKFVTMKDNFDGLTKWKNDMRELGVKHTVATGTLIPRTNRDAAPLVQLLTDAQYKELLELQPSQGDGGAHFCRPGQIRGAITPDGGVSPCEWLTDFKFGNIKEQPLQEIWHSTKSQEFRNIFQEDSECPSCDLRPGCSRCPAHSYLETGNLLHCAPTPRHYAELNKQAGRTH
ncbi:MAG TPA: PqqD family peptide modification chaperone [Candidatus Angelobacter sp.]|jgi:radical SAM protein with 4Fe4S-binding SPASM domain|nr:PqqD family peptide modification chaperone [Candidatus Angelobacter sp.]